LNKHYKLKETNSPLSFGIVSPYCIQISNHIK